MIDRHIKRLNKNLNDDIFANKVVSENISVRKIDLHGILNFLEDCKEFNCTKNNLGNLANHLEDGKEYVILVKEVDSNK